MSPFPNTNPLVPRIAPHSRTLLNARDVLGRITHLARAALEPSIRVTLALSPQTGHVLGDSRKFDHALLNLILSARSAMPEGGDLLVATSNVDRETRGRIQKFVRVVVADNGAGIKREIESARRATAERIICECGGEMKFRSAPGLGTSFELLLPRIENIGLAAFAALPSAA